MEREQLVGARFGDGRHRVSALAVSGSTLYAGGDFTTAGGSAANYIAQWDGSSWSALGSGIQVDDGYGPMCVRWRCRAARCMRGAISRRRAAARPITSRNGTGAVGRRWVRGCQAATMTAPMCMRWRCRAARCMRAAISRRRAATRPITSPNGTGAVGRPSVRGFR